MTNPFDYVKSINESKKDIMVDEMSEKAYNAFIVNRALSYFQDTVFQANEMNRLHHIPKPTQYKFLLNTVRARKRWAGKWHKQEKNADVDVIMETYGYSQEKARQVLELLTADQLKELKRNLDPGGIKTKK
jgi:hypothetical protein